MAEVRWRGARLAPASRAMSATCRRRIWLFPWRSALANTTLGLEIRQSAARRGGEPRESAAGPTGPARFRRLLPLDPLGRHASAGRPGAHAFVNDPAILLLDEPFAALDFQTKLLIESDTAKLVRNTGRAVLLITHRHRGGGFASRSRHRPHGATDPGQGGLRISPLGEDRTDMIAAREHPRFADYVRRIWSDLEGFAIILDRIWPVPVWRRIGHFQWDDPGSTAYRRSPHG